MSETPRVIRVCDLCQAQTAHTDETCTVCAYKSQAVREYMEAARRTATRVVAEAHIRKGGTQNVLTHFPL